jgi:hypothetical protein
VTAGWQVAPGVGVLRGGSDQASGHGATVYAAHLPGGPIQVLTGVSAVVFTACAEPGDEPLALRVSAALGVDEADLDTEALEDFLGDLAAAGLLVRSRD